MESLCQAVLSQSVSRPAGSWCQVLCHFRIGTLVALSDATVIAIVAVKFCLAGTAVATCKTSKDAMK